MKISSSAATLFSVAFVGAVAGQQDFKKFELPTDDLDNTHLDDYNLTGEIGPLTLSHNTHTDYKELGIDDDRNYDKNGTDWNFENCNATTIQSPFNITRVDESSSTYFDWFDNGYSFLPNFRSVKIL